MAVTDEQISRVLNAVPKGLLIGGKWISTEKTVPVEDPSTGEVLRTVQTTLLKAASGRIATHPHRSVVVVVRSAEGSQVVGSHRRAGTFGDHPARIDPSVIGLP